jgi:hypothetical protein
MTKRERDFYQRLLRVNTTDDAAAMGREAQRNYREAKTDKGRKRWDMMSLLAFRLVIKHRYKIQ